jgi:tellurite resistance protein
MTSSDAKIQARDFDEPKLEALIETMFLAAHADGEFSEEEKAHFIASVESLTDARLSRDKLEELVQRIHVEAEKAGREARLAAVKSRLPDPRVRKVALSLAIQVTASDGIIRTSERELILEVAEALEIDRGEAADLVKALARGA